MVHVRHEERAAGGEGRVMAGTPLTKPAGSGLQEEGAVLSVSLCAKVFQGYAITGCIMTRVKVRRNDRIMPWLKFDCVCYGGQERGGRGEGGEREGEREGGGRERGEGGEREGGEREGEREGGGREGRGERGRGREVGGERGRGRERGRGGEREGEREGGARYND